MEPIHIIGGGLGGLSAAMHLRIRGRPVILHEAQKRVGGRAYQIEALGCRFDTGPSLLNYPWVFEDWFQAAGARMADRLRLRRVDPSITFRWPDGTHFTLTTELPALRQEMERLEPGAGVGLLKFLADAEIKYNFAFRKLVTNNARNPIRWFGRLTLSEIAHAALFRSLYGELGRFFKSPRIKEALGSYAMYLGGSPWRLPGLFSILPFGELAYGLWLPEGGIYALVEAMGRVVRESGVEVRTNAPVRAIESERGAVRGLRMADGTFEPARRVVSNVDVPTTWHRLLGRPSSRTPAMTPGVVTGYLVLRRRPEGLGHHTIFLPERCRATFDRLHTGPGLPDELAFYTSLPTDTDPSLAPPGFHTLFILVPTPVLSRIGPVDGPALIADARARVFDRLRQHGCDIRDTDIAHEQFMAPSDWSDQFGLFDGSAFGAAHTMFQLGPFRSPNRDPHTRGLYYVGASTTPGTGLPLVTLGGRMVANTVLADDGGAN
ncbi:MAG: phytoene desaturase [Kiritimatiellae bacterium]|nr:phytoene desaturase [Kiritimatiellia bacterium]